MSVGPGCQWLTPRQSTFREAQPCLASRRWLCYDTPRKAAAEGSAGYAGRGARIIDSAVDICNLTSGFRATIGGLHGLLRMPGEDAGEPRVWTFS
jgi:hypothetical protein